MPSPFPGMDPYLEGSLWTTVHFSLSAEIVRQLTPKLRPRYLVLPAERITNRLKYPAQVRQLAGVRPSYEQPVCEIKWQLR